MGTPASVRRSRQRSRSSAVAAKARWPGPVAPWAGTGRAPGAAGCVGLGRVEDQEHGLADAEEDVAVAGAGDPGEAEEAAVEGLGRVEVGGVEGGFQDAVGHRVRVRRGEIACKGCAEGVAFTREIWTYLIVIK